MLTSAEQPPSSNNEKGSKNKPSNIGACNTASLPLNINKPNETNAPLIYADFSAKCSDDGQLVRRLRCNGSISSSMLIYIYIFIYRLSCLICGFSFTKGPNEMQRRCTNISKHCPPSAINRRRGEQAKRSSTYMREVLLEAPRAVAAIN